jgi:hypothetical protein
MNKWHKLVLPRKNLYGWVQGLERVGNHIHYREIKEWCYDHLPKGKWQSYIEGETGKKVFLFKEEKYLTLFLLKWMSECK